MRKLCLVICFNVVFKMVQCQTSPWVGALAVNPQSLTTTGQLTVITTATTSSYGVKVGVSQMVNHFTKVISLQGCYSQSMLTALRPYQDTFYVSSLQPGVYTIVFKAIESASTTSCVAVNSNSVAATVTVTGLTTEINEHNLEKSIPVFPNPVQNTLNLGKIYSAAIITGVNGGVVRRLERMSDSVDVSDLPAGIYFIQLFSEKQIVSLKFIKE